MPWLVVGAGGSRRGLSAAKYNAAANSTHGNDGGVGSNGDSLLPDV